MQGNDECYNEKQQKYYSMLILLDSSYFETVKSHIALLFLYEFTVVVKNDGMRTVFSFKQYDKHSRLN